MVNQITIPISHQCDTCAGQGYSISDSYNHEGGHLQHEYTCEVCEGSGLKSKEEIAEMESQARIERESKWLD